MTILDSGLLFFGHPVPSYMSILLSRVDFRKLLFLHETIKKCTCYIIVAFKEYEFLCQKYDVTNAQFRNVYRVAQK